jgi:hypothetical protein
MRKLAWLLDEALDHLPRIEGGKWHWFGDWGCQLRLSRFWLDPANPTQQVDNA